MEDRGRVFPKKMALVYGSLLSRPNLLSQPSSLIPDVTLLLPPPSRWQEWLFWAPSWHDRLQTISGLKKGGGEGEIGGWIRRVRPQCSVGPESLKEENWERTLGFEREKPSVDMALI